jgi:hypothetical protein
VVIVKGGPSWVTHHPLDASRAENFSIIDALLVAVDACIPLLLHPQIIDCD